MALADKVKQRKDSASSGSKLRSASKARKSSSLNKTQETNIETSAPKIPHILPTEMPTQPIKYKYLEKFSMIPSLRRKLQ